MTAKKPTEKKGRDKAVQDLLHDQGRMARRQSIAKEDAPFDSESDEYKAWVKGWDYEDKL